MARARKKRTTKATVRSGAAAKGRLRARKRYRMIRNIPPQIARTTTAYSILTQIQKHKGRATFDHIQARLPKVPLPTIRFYLGKFQRDKIISGA